MKTQHLNKKTTVLGILFLLLLLNLLPGAASEEKEKPYVILISFDGFRWDYGQRGISPTLKKMAETGVSALSLQPVFPTKTFPNHYSLVTGLYPQNHGIVANQFTDPFSGKQYLAGRDAEVHESRWYWGEPIWETAERQGIVAGTYFWVGSELNVNYRRSTYLEAYEHSRTFKERVEGVLNWLKLPEPKRPHFITLYFHATDSAGHRFGPDHPKTNDAIKELDLHLGQLITGLKELKLLAKTNIIIVSDHGMAEVSGKRLVNIEKRLQGMEFKIQRAYTPVMMIYCPETEKEKIYKKLQREAEHYTVYYREEVPGYFHFSNHPFISPIVLIASPGWSLVDNAMEKRLSRRDSFGNHGYDNHLLDMHGIFYAMGPAFKKGYRTGTVRTVDIYPLLCKILNIMPRRPIDGKLERIEFVLK
ncbi:MAG: alkaline phosphatase family protein [bacterium]|nr:alkaline phosphatase family protein [bacterium]